jgi:hypothetical protein
MSPSQRGRLLLGAWLALLVMVPLRHLLEQHMLTHMLVQIPVLLLAGVLTGTAAPRLARMTHWNMAGVPALFAASLVLAFWMTPIAIDHAVASAGWDAAKAVSIVFAGAIAAAAWRVAPTVVQAFFGGNMVWMSVAAGQLYQAEGPRLCNAYLQDDQALTGIALTGLAIATAGLWIGRVAWPHSRLHQPIPTSPGDAAHET